MLLKACAVCCKTTALVQSVRGCDSCCQDGHLFQAAAQLFLSGSRTHSVSHAAAFGAVFTSTLARCVH
jgi:hypothetical protein